MKKVKIAELEGVSLDYAVADTYGMAFTELSSGFGFNHNGTSYAIGSTLQIKPYMPSRDDEQANHLINLGMVELFSPENEKDEWTATCRGKQQTGRTRCEAAMRCFVASRKNADVVEIPLSLIPFA